MSTFTKSLGGVLFNFVVFYYLVFIKYIQDIDMYIVSYVYTVPIPVCVQDN